MSPWPSLALRERVPEWTAGTVNDIVCLVTLTASCNSYSVDSSIQELVAKAGPPSPRRESSDTLHFPDEIARGDKRSQTA